MQTSDIDASFHIAVVVQVLPCSLTISVPYLHQHIFCGYLTVSLCEHAAFFFLGLLTRSLLGDHLARVLKMVTFLA